jgi:hypothetical protein
MTIGNKYEDAVVACKGCNTKAKLHQVAFRNETDHVVGYIFLCDDCHIAIADGKHGINVVEL